MTHKLLRFCLLYLMLLMLTHNANSIDTHVVPYYVRFLDIAAQCKIKVNNVETRIEMSSRLHRDIAARCNYHQNVIEVNSTQWSVLDDTEKEQLIFHELGHCLLNIIGHDDTGPNIMNSNGFLRSSAYIHYYDYFVRRLFKKCEKDVGIKFVYKETNNDL